MLKEGQMISTAWTEWAKDKLERDKVRKDTGDQIK